MRFIWFNLMPWPHLPEDFREKYRSVWVDIPSSLYDPVRGHAVYNDYLDQLEFAETVGFDGLGVNEHHANAYGLMPSPTLMAAALARRTSRAALVVLGSSIALYDPDPQGLGGRRAVCLQRPLYPAALRQLLAKAGAEASPTDLHPRWRLGGDLRFLH